MAGLNVDPKQKPITIVLIVILVAAVGTTVARINPSQPSSGPAKAQSQPAGIKPDGTGDEVSCDFARNPFEKPPSLAVASVAATDGQPQSSSGDDPRRNPVKVNPWVGGGDSRLEPLSAAFMAAPGETAKTKGQPVRNQTEQSSKPKPTFALLATVRGPDGYSAVIRAGSGAARVAEIGDILEGGFRIVRLEPGLAVLTDGRKVIVARRPQS